MRIPNVQLNLRLLLPVLLVFVFSACGGSDGDTSVSTATPAPTLTADERVTFAIGSAENPLQMMLVPVSAVEEQVKATLSETLDIPIEALSLDDSLGDGLSQLTTPLTEIFQITFASDRLEEIETGHDLVVYIHELLSDEIETQLFNRTSIAFEVVPVDRDAEALHDLCESGNGIAAIAWLDGVSYTAARADNCGIPALQVATFGRGYNQVILTETAESEIEVTPEIEITAEATEDATAEVTPEITPSPEPTETLFPTETPDPEETPEPESTPLPEINVGAEIYFTRGLILLDRRLGSQNLDVLRGRTFCRLGYDDFYSWLVPTLYMESVNIDPQRDLATVVDYSNAIALVRALVDGECTATGMSQDTYDNLNETYPELLADVRLANVATAFPYPILMYPVDLDLGVRLALNDVFTELGAEPDSAFMWLLGHDVLIAFEPERIAGFSAFMASTGLDFSQLGD